MRLSSSRYSHTNKKRAIYMHIHIHTHTLAKRTNPNLTLTQCMLRIKEGVKECVGSPNGSMQSIGSFNGKLAYTHTKRETHSLLHT